MTAFLGPTGAIVAEEDARFAASKSLAVHLVLTSANAPGNVQDVDRYEARYRGRGYTGLTIDRKSFNIAHNDVADPSFDWALICSERAAGPQARRRRAEPQLAACAPAPPEGARRHARGARTRG